MAKGIDLKDLSGRKVTDEENVLLFFSEHPNKAFTIDLLQNEYKFSSNIRKVLKRLEEKGQIKKNSIYQEKNKWVFAYFLENPIRPNYLVKKVNEIGWILDEINIYNNIFKLSNWNVADDSISFDLEFLKNFDCVIYSKNYNEDLDKEILQSIRYSDIESELIENNRIVNFTLSDLSDYEYDQYIDDLKTAYVKSEESEFESLSPRKKKIGYEVLDIALGPVSFQFNINQNKRYLEVMSFSWDEEDNREDRILINTVSLGWNEEEEEEEIFISDVEKVLFYF